MEPLSPQKRAELIEQEPWLVNESGAFTGGNLRGRIKDLWGRRELIRMLAKREIRARYKDSSLGFLWSFARPLSQFAVYFFALGQILGMSRSIPDFAIFVFVGLTGWGFFSESIQKGASAITHNAGLIKKVQLPREVFPLAGTGSVLIMSAIQAAVLILAILILGKIPSFGNLGYALAGILVLVVFTYGIALFLSAINVYFRDTEHLIEVSLVVLFWASPIVYSFSFVHEKLQGNWLEQLYLSNPITIAIMAMQKGLWSAGSTDERIVWPSYFEARIGVMFVLGTLVVWGAHRVFARLEGNFAQEI